MLVLDVADDGFDGGTALHQFFETVCDAALLALGEDAERVGVSRMVAAIGIPP
jgi:hypothetical protein